MHSIPRSTETLAKKIPLQNATETPSQPTSLCRPNFRAPGAWDIVPHALYAMLIRMGAGALGTDAQRAAPTKYLQYLTLAVCT